MHIELIIAHFWCKSTRRYFKMFNTVHLENRFKENNDTVVSAKKQKQTEKNQERDAKGSTNESAQRELHQDLYEEEWMK